MGEGRVGVLKARTIIAQSEALGENEQDVYGYFISPPQGFSPLFSHLYLWLRHRLKYNALSEL